MSEYMMYDEMVDVRGFGTSEEEWGPSDLDDYDEGRDRAEEEYWAAYCDACGTRGCTWDGVTDDGYHV